MGGGRGGPGTSTNVVELYIFNALIRTSLPGIAAAASVLLFVVSVLLIFPLFRARRRANDRRRRHDQASQRAQARRAAPCLVPGPGADAVHDLDGAEERRGLCDRQARPALSAGAREFPLGDRRQPVRRLDGQQPDPGRRRGRAEHRRLLPCRLCHRLHGVPRAALAAGRQHLADGRAADRDDRAALRALFAARADQHLSGRHHHLCRADHALLGLSADHLLPHRAEGAVRVRAHRRRGRFHHPAARSCCRCRCPRS